MVGVKHWGAGGRESLFRESKLIGPQTLFQELIFLSWEHIHIFPLGLTDFYVPSIIANQLHLQRVASKIFAKKLPIKKASYNHAACIY